MDRATLPRMGTNRKDRIEALKKKKEALAHRIVRLSNLESAKDRKRRTRRLILDGLLLEHVLKTADPAVVDRWQTRRNSFLERDRDRALFDLPPRPPKEESQ